MADGTPKTSAHTALPSPKLVRNRSTMPVPGSAINAAFGCEHIEDFYKSGEKNWKIFGESYGNVLQSLHCQNRIVGQTFRNGKNTTQNTAIRPTWLCVQCPFVFSDETRRSHWSSPNKHSFFVDSRSGSVYCHNCEDFVYDPHLERIRMNKGNKKRKFDDYISSEDYRTVQPNSTHVPCRAIGLRGLYNMGNTCFMSVVLQSLLHNPLLRSYFLSNGHKNCEIEFCISCALEEIYSEFYSFEKTEGFGAVNMLMSSWKTAEASNSELAGYQQQDAHEYMQFLLNSLHASNGGASGADCSCIIHRMFYGRLQSIVTCDKCNNKTTTKDPFLDLSLDLRPQGKKKPNADNKSNEEANILRLEDCLKRFVGKEKIPAADYTCRKCATQRDAVKQFSIQSLPPVLSLHLKRFSHNKDKSSKVSTPVKFPLTLDMLPFMTPYVTPDAFFNTNGINGTKRTNGIANGTAKDPSTPVKGKSVNDDTPKTPSKGDANIVTDYTSLQDYPKEYWPPELVSYELSAVIVHKGEINSGHYVNYAREGKEWFLFDDSKVVLVSETDVLAAEAYLLVYVAKDISQWADF